MTALIITLAAGTGTGLWLVLLGLFPHPPQLASALAALDPQPRPTPPPDPAAPASWSIRLGQPLAHWLSRAGLPTAGTRRELATLNRPTSTHLAEQATTTIIGLLIPPGFALLLTAGNIHLDITIPAAASLALAAAGFLIPELTVRAEAAKLRAGFRHALGSFLDLVVVSLASGAGVDQALHDTARAGTGPAYAELRYALTQARDSRIPPWQTLAELGRRLRIDELQHLAATVGLAGTEGATVRTSLQARAAAIRARQLTDTEATALSATERMSLPIVLLLCGFLLLIGYPAITAVLGL